MKCGSVSDRAFNPDPSSMRLNYMPGDCQAKAGSRLPLSSLMLALIKVFENVLHLARRNTGAIVGDLDFNR